MELVKGTGKSGPVMDLVKGTDFPGPGMELVKIPGKPVPFLSSLQVTVPLPVTVPGMELILFTVPVPQNLRKIWN